ncbi:MAG: cytochrome c oxidase accessory protein CcoG [Bacteroidetes bacterium]|nr:cytochrome c oxidase accessory protein CcoG [Bacteroidota bacterium]
MSAIIEPDQHNFRDSLSMLEADGSRKWIFAKKPKGPLYNKRIIASVIYLIIFFGLPWLQYHNEPLFMLNVVTRKFIIFGLHFGVQDLIVFGLAMLSFVVFVVLFTVVFGRLFCGWACPQTIFMEMVFRRIEYWIEGDAQQQRNLSKSKWNSNKIFKRSLKYLIFFLVSFAIANTFLAYIIGLPELKKIITEPISEHLLGLVILIVFTGVFFSVYAFLREQICIVACPYGRLQGVMLDKKTIVVAYDYKRGEPRGKLQKSSDGNAHGDCIDCYACVAVCPTGIDIRNGTQLECINCTACIDACNDIMHKVHKPLGLIRYASEDNIVTKRKTRITPRIVAYSAVLLILLGVLSFTFLSHSVIDASILRTPGQFYQEHDDNTISNLYNFKVANKRGTPMHIHFVLNHHEGKIQVIGKKEIIVPPGDEQQGQLFIFMPNGTIHKKNEKVKVDIYDSTELVQTISTTFMAPLQ